MKRSTWIILVLVFVVVVMGAMGAIALLQQDPITHTMQVMLEITPAVDFTPVVSPDFITSRVNRTVAYNITAISVDGFVGDVTINISNLPAGVTVSYFSGNTFTVSPGSSTGIQADIHISSEAEIGTHTLTVTWESTQYN